MVESIQLAHEVVAGRADDDVLGWLRAGLTRHLAGESLDVALGLDRASRMRARNRALVAAERAIGRGESDNARAQALLEAIRRFESRVLPRLKPGAELPPIDAALLEAHRTGIRLPGTVRQLTAILF